MNMIDEARSRGIYIDAKKLGELLGTEVIPTVATRRQGINSLIKSISSPVKPNISVDYGVNIESGICGIQDLVSEKEKITRLIAIMFLAGEHGIEKWFSSRFGIDAFEKAETIALTISL